MIGSMSKPHVIRLSEAERREVETLTPSQLQGYKNLRESEIGHKLALQIARES